MYRGEKNIEEVFPMKFCTNCKRTVRPTKKPWSWLEFFVFLGIFYPIYRISLPTDRCVICGGKTLISRKKAVSEGLLEA